jgi:hypothetical protein
MGQKVEQINPGWPTIFTSHVGKLAWPQVRCRYYRDPESGIPHIENHDVSELEVADAFLSRREDRAGRDGSRVAIGRTRSGRILRVIYVRDEVADSTFVITAYDLRGPALKAFQRRQRRRKGH